VVADSDEDRSYLRTVCLHFKWCAVFASTIAAAREELRRDPWLVICDAFLADGSWKDLLDEIRHRRSAALLIVTSRAADEQLWAEVLYLGGYDVLATPFEPEEVGHALALAHAKRPTGPRWAPEAAAAGQPAVRWPLAARQVA
jgi:DNA-binding response OmpR family regulator